LAALFPRVVHAFLIGRDATSFAAELARHHVPCSIVETLDRAVPQALRAAHETNADGVLLSPAGASFDQFSGFEARGTRFRDLVRMLAGEQAGVV
jgi:UDP-N-acetylmuramoylalanine--D-glutamate ligase